MSTSLTLAGKEQLSRLWHLLTDPSAQVTVPDDQRKARILSTMLLIALPLAFGGVVAPLIVSGVPDLTQVPEFWFAVISCLILLIAYAFSRTAFYQLGALIAIVSTWIIVFLVLWLTPAKNQFGFFYLVVPVLLSGVFLSMRTTIIVAVINILGMYVFVFLSPDVTLIDISVSISFNLIMYPLMFLAFQQRALLETQRQKQNQEEELQAESLRMELDKERQLGELRNQFMTMISHEFRTPLATILSSSQILERYRDRMDYQKQMGYFNIISEQVHRLTHMIEDVLLLSRLAAGQIHLELANQNVVNFSRAIIGGMRVEPERIQLKVQGSDEIVYFDPTALEAILKKLLSNAVKYSANDSVVEVDLAPSKHGLHIVVGDHGIGIPPDDQVHLYEHFHRGSNISNIPGTGLGLSIVKHYVDLMQGQITVTSELDRGTTFEVNLPCPSSSNKPHTAQ